jgi:hypothetical protein
VDCQYGYVYLLLAMKEDHNLWLAAKCVICPVKPNVILQYYVGSTPMLISRTLNVKRNILTVSKPHLFTTTKVIAKSFTAKHLADTLFVLETLQ